MPRRRLALVGALALAVAVASVRDDAAPTPAPSRSPGPIVSAWMADAYRLGSCATTPSTTWLLFVDFGIRKLPEPPRPMVIGGRLATQPTRNLTGGTSWWIADTPREVIHLRATRLDRDGTTVDIDAVGRASGETLPNGFDHRWTYVTSAGSAERLPTPRGCWKVQWLDGDPERDVIVVELRGAAPRR